MSVIVVTRLLLQYCEQWNGDGQRVFQGNGHRNGTCLVAHSTRGRRSRSVTRCTLQIRAFLRAVDGIATSHLAVGVAVAVPVAAALQQDSRPEEVAACLHRRQVAVVDLQAKRQS